MAADDADGPDDRSRRRSEECGDAAIQGEFAHVEEADSGDPLAPAGRAHREPIERPGRARAVTVGIRWWALVASRFREALRRRREAAGLTQEALAAEAGLHRNYVGLLERGKRVPSILVVEKLAGALGTTMSSLLREMEKRSA